MEKKMNNKGFSLVELIVVIAIMAVLVGVLAPQFIKYVEKSRQSTDVTNLDSIKTVVETYYADKEGTDLPAFVLIAADTNKVYKTYKLSASAWTGTTQDEVTEAVKQGGVENTPIKGKWTKGTGNNNTGKTPAAIWNTATNEWSYQAESDYYGIKNNKIVTE